MKKLATVEVDIKGLDLGQFQQKEHNGQMMVKLDMELEVHFGSRRGVLCFIVVVAGKEAGSVSVSFDGDDFTGGLKSVNGPSESATSCVIQ